MKRIVFYLFGFTMLASCTTYKTYYAETRESLAAADVKNTYRLDLSFQELEQLPENIIEYKEIRAVKLTGNVGLDLEDAVSKLAALPNLRVLILDSMQLWSLPENFQKLKRIEHLSLVNNPKLDWGKTFEQLADFPLEFLNLSHNQITELPDQISQIKTLRDLKLSHNTLDLSQTFFALSELPKLRALWLDFNEIARLPEEVATLSQLQYLYLDGNKLTALPSAMRRLERLLVMHAAQNRFTELPGVLTQMPRLLFVIFSNNPIAEIPPIFHNKQYALLALVMDGNELDADEKQFYKQMFRRFFIFSAE
ncbi:MAG: leucine-rich repeat domain-containing protein [Bacteroidetes bacterium]|nr:leucine-rich repeat domain-containing protein [Bacteroidota bacterium]